MEEKAAPIPTHLTSPSWCTGGWRKALVDSVQADGEGPPKTTYDPRSQRRAGWCGKRKVRVRNLVRKRIEDTLEKAGWCGKHIEHQRPDDDFPRLQHLDLVTEALSNMIRGQTRPTRRRLSSIVQAGVLSPPPAQIHPAPMVRKHIEPR